MGGRFCLLVSVCLVVILFTTAPLEATRHLRFKSGITFICLDIVISSYKLRFNVHYYCSHTKCTTVFWWDREASVIADDGSWCSIFPDEFTKESIVYVSNDYSDPSPTPVSPRPKPSPTAPPPAHGNFINVLVHSFCHFILIFDFKT
jgi:hypothetical protein